MRVIASRRGSKQFGNNVTGEEGVVGGVPDGGAVAANGGGNVPMGAPIGATIGATGVGRHAASQNNVTDIKRIPNVTIQGPRGSKYAIAVVTCAMASILFPLPDRDFDVTEFAVPWHMLTKAGHRCVFATQGGAAGPVPACDPLLLTGVVFGQLGARPEPIAFYRRMEKSPEFNRPRAWAECHAAEFDALFLGGGHAPGMRQYLGSAEVQRVISEFFADAKKPIAAICHGVLAAARSPRADGCSVLHGYKTTCLPKFMERSAYFSTFWRRGRYYRTYPAYVQDEVTAVLARAEDFSRGPRTLSKRGTATDDSQAFVVEDPGGRYLSARWPGDAYLLAKQLLRRLSL